MEWLFERLKEKTTWMGLISLLASANIYHLGQSATEAIVAAAVAISGAVLVIMKEKK